MARCAEVSVRLTVRSEPFRSEPQDAAAYYEAMGRVLTIWGRFEHNFTLDLLFMSRFPGAADILTPFPHTFGKKLKAFKKCFSHVDFLLPYVDQANALATFVTEIVTKRNVVAHGSFWGFASTDPLTAKISMIKVVESGEKFGFQEYRCTLDEMRQLVTDVDSINTHFVGLSGLVVTLGRHLEDRLPG